MNFSKIGKHRLIYGHVMCLVALLLSRHDAYALGIVIALLGVALRIWSAGYIEKNDRLATGGPYSFCRNPLYLGSFTFGAGAVIAIQAWWLLPIYAAGFALFYVPTVLGEQKFLRGKFGEDYAEFCRKTPSFIPYKINFGGSGRFSLQKAMDNREHIHATVSVVYLLVLALVGHFRAG